MQNNNTVKTVRLNKDGYVKKNESYQETLKEEGTVVPSVCTKND